MTTDLARNARISALTMCSRSGASHIGSALSVIDILAVLYGQVADVSPGRTDDPARDIVLVSTGHRNTCALQRSGGVICWGELDVGVHGPPDLPANK